MVWFGISQTHGDALHNFYIHPHPYEALNQIIFPAQMRTTQEQLNRFSWTFIWDNIIKKDSHAIVIFIQMQQFLNHFM
jgi:hypothetical protein